MKKLKALEFHFDLNQAPVYCIRRRKWLLLTKISRLKLRLRELMTQERRN